MGRRIDKITVFIHCLKRIVAFYLINVKMSKSTWTFNPTTRIIPDKKKDKKKFKEEMRGVE